MTKRSKTARMKVSFKYMGASDNGRILDKKIGKGTYANVYSVRGDRQVMKIFSEEAFAEEEAEVLKKLKGVEGVVRMYADPKTIRPKSLHVRFENSKASDYDICWFQKKNKNFMNIKETTDLTSCEIRPEAKELKVKVTDSIGNIAFIHETSVKSQAYLLLDHLGNCRLTDYIYQSLKYMPPISRQMEIRRLMKCMLTSLVRIHSNGVVHMDIKSDNIMYTCGQPVFIDFGRANFTQNGSVPFDIDNLYGGAFCLQPPEILRAVEAHYYFHAELSSIFNLWSILHPEQVEREKRIAIYDYFIDYAQSKTTEPIKLSQSVLKRLNSLKLYVDNRKDWTFNSKADSFTMGCLFYRMLTQKGPNGYAPSTESSVSFLIQKVNDEMWKKSMCFRQLNVDTQNLLCGLMHLDPKRRLTCAEALAHPYFTDIF